MLNHRNSCLFLLPSFLFSANVFAKEKMNIVLIMADDFGYECLGINGGESYLTPNIDRLAEKGVRFTHCYANPLSTPSRVQLMTGKYNVRNYVSFGKLDRGEVTFGNLLQQAGYATCISGKWQLGKELDSPQHFGFEQACLWQHQAGAVDPRKHDTRYANPVLEINGVKKEYTNGEFAPEIACDFVLDFIQENRERPFFVYYPMILTHCPFIPTPDSEEWDGKRSKSYKGKAVHFADMVAYADKLVGRIVKELERLNLTENTMIIFTGDNGTDKPIVSILDGKPYVGGKSKTIDAGIHVPLIVSSPTGERAKMNDNLIDFTDFLPTLCEATEIDIPTDLTLDGRSFYPQIKGKKGDARQWTYCWYAPRNVKDSAAKVFARNHIYKLYRSGEFYNIVDDFNEQNPIKTERLSRVEKKNHKLLLDAINSFEGIR